MFSVTNHCKNSPPVAFRGQILGLAYSLPYLLCPISNFTSLGPLLRAHVFLHHQIQRFPEPWGSKFHHATTSDRSRYNKTPLPPPFSIFSGCDLKISGELVGNSLSAPLSSDCDISMNGEVAGKGASVLSLRDIPLLFAFVPYEVVLLALEVLL